MKNANESQSCGGALKNLHVNDQRFGMVWRLYHAIPSHTQFKSVPPLEEQRPFDPSTGIQIAHHCTLFGSCTMPHVTNSVEARVNSQR